MKAVVLIIIFLKRKILSLETILSAYTRTHTHRQKHPHTRCFAVLSLQKPILHYFHGCRFVAEMAFDWSASPGLTSSSQISCVHLTADMVFVFVFVFQLCPGRSDHLRLHYNFRRLCVEVAPRGNRDFHMSKHGNQAMAKASASDRPMKLNLHIN